MSLTKLHPCLLAKADPPKYIFKIPPTNALISRWLPFLPKPENDKALVAVDDDIFQEFGVQALLPVNPMTFAQTKSKKLFLYTDQKRPTISILSPTFSTSVSGIATRALSSSSSSSSSTFAAGHTVAAAQPRMRIPKKPPGYRSIQDEQVMMEQKKYPTHSKNHDRIPRQREYHHRHHDHRRDNDNSKKRQLDDTRASERGTKRSRWEKSSSFSPENRRSEERDKTKNSSLRSPKKQKREAQTSSPFLSSPTKPSIEDLDPAYSPRPFVFYPEDPLPLHPHSHASDPLHPPPPPPAPAPDQTQTEQKLFDDLAQQLKKFVAQLSTTNPALISAGFQNTSK